MTESASKCKPLTISLPAKLAKEIRIAAAKQDKTRSRFVRDVLEDFLDKEGCETQLGDEQVHMDRRGVFDG